jgi:type I restriction enzyme, S subunit
VIKGFKPYPAYKPSGALWIGEVPEHWQLPRLGTVLRERGETNERGDVTAVLSVMRDRGVIPYADKGNVGNKKSDDITRYKIVRPDDIVVNCMNVIIGSVGLSRYTGCLSPVYYVLARRFTSDDPRYLNAYFQTKPFQLSLIRIGNGILAHRMRIPMELLKCEPFPRPPTEEQAAIVRFLDHADRRIRSYIRAKKKLIALLNEQKQAIIQRAVMRGLDPNVCLKPSGLELLGDVPAQWEVMPMQRVLAFGPKNGVSAPAANVGGVLSFSISAVRDGRINIAGNEKYVALDAARAARFEIANGDILMVRGNGNLSFVAKSGLVIDCPSNCTYPDILIKVRPVPSVAPEFLVLALNSAYVTNQVALLAKTTNGTFKISGASIRSLTLAIPPRIEQERIIRELSRAFEGIDRTRDRAQREISLLNEYRTQLVADAVTGKIDVRQAAVDLPDAPATSEDEGFLAEDAAESDAAEVDDADAEDTA